MLTKIVTPLRVKLFFVIPGPLVFGMPLPFKFYQLPL